MNFEEAFKKIVSDKLLRWVEYFLEWRLIAYERKLAKQFVKEFGWK